MVTPSSPESPVWSRGSTRALEEDAPLERPNLYRFEGCGVLVYDCQARRAGTTPRQRCDREAKRPLSPLSKRELETALESDKAKYERRKPYPSYPPFTTDYTLEVPEDVLLFDSRFESGNLARAVRLHPHNYALYLNYDTETKGHTQWFYFSVCNSSQLGTYVFNIVNLMKYDSLYNEGLLPVVRSEKDGNSWKRGGFAVSYCHNSTTKTYTLSFSYTFHHTHDTVYFAHSVPYTFTDLCKYLDTVKSSKCEIARVSPMCRTLCGSVCDLVTVTQNVGSYRTHEQEVMEWNMSAAARRLNKQRIERQERLAESIGRKSVDEHKRKQGLIFTARVHPGETPGSFLMKGVLDFLLGDSREARLIRKHYVCKIVPMLNPDGVRYGNYRCSTLGVDLNRRWACPSRLLHPTIYHTKKMIQAFSVWHNIVLFCDFHGHSCKRGVFAYGCARKSCDLEDRKKSLLARMIPILLSQQTPLFSLKDCHFRIQKSKESTARVVAYKELGIVNSYTVEASFYGPRTGSCFAPPRSDCHMQQSDYEGIGRELTVVCLAFASSAVFTRKLRAVSEWIREMNCGKTGKKQVKRCGSLHGNDGFTPKGIGGQTGITERGKAPSSAPRLKATQVDSLSELDCIREEEDEVVSEALQQDGIWEDLLEQEEVLTSSEEDAESDSSPSDDGEVLRLPPPRLRKPTKKKPTKVCHTEPSDDPEDLLPRRSSHQAFRPFHPKPLKQAKSPRTNSSAGTFSEAIRSSVDGQKEQNVGMKKPGRLIEVLRKSVAVREELRLHINSLGKQVSGSPLRNGHREISPEEFSARGASVQPFRSKPVERPRLPPPPDITFRRLPRHRPLRDGTTIEAVLQSLEQRKKSECELGAETSLLSVLPKVQARDLGMDRYLGFAGKNKGSFRIRLDRRG